MRHRRHAGHRDLHRPGPALLPARSRARSHQHGRDGRREFQGGPRVRRRGSGGRDPVGAVGQAAGACGMSLQATGNAVCRLQAAGHSHRLSGCGADWRDDVFPGQPDDDHARGRAPAAAARNALPGGRSPAAPRPSSLVHRPHDDCARDLLFRRRRDGDAAAGNDLGPDRPARRRDAHRQAGAAIRHPRGEKSGRRGRDPDRRLQRHALGGRGPRPEAAAAPGPSRRAGGEPDGGAPDS